MPNQPARVVQTKLDKVVMRPPIKAQMPPDVKRDDLDFDNSFGVQVEDAMPTFVPVKGLFGKDGDLTRLTRETFTIGILVNCEDQVWYVEGEPTGPMTAGVMVYAPQHGK